MSYRNSVAFLPMVLALAAGAFADINVYSDGSDGELFVGADQAVTIDLGEAVTGDWDDPSSTPGAGIFDAEKWAVVFKYSGVTIEAGATVTFANHPSGAPVVWLVQGDVDIAGTVNLNGARGQNDAVRIFAIPGPGGFRGGAGYGAGLGSSAGFGPGGSGRIDGANYGSGGSYATSGGQGAEGAAEAGPVYGNSLILPLIGGSGAAGGSSRGGGAGGGAILIASAATISLSGGITANGGDYGGGENVAGGGGSGGAIKLIADSVTGAGTIHAIGGEHYRQSSWDYSGAGGYGRIRVEANTCTLENPSDPEYSAGLPGEDAMIWPDEFTPIVRVISLNGLPVSLSPKRGLYFSNQELFMRESGVMPLMIQAYNVPADATMTVRLVRKSGPDSQFTATLVDEPAGMWQADIELPDQISAIQVHAVLP